MTDLNNSASIAAIVESFRKEMIDVVNQAADDLLDTLTGDSGAHPVASVKIPTLAQCQDPKNKTENGVNLTERGVEVLRSPGGQPLGLGQPGEEVADQAQRPVVDVDPVAHLPQVGHRAARLRQRRAAGASAP